MKTLKKSKMNYFSPLPPLVSGISDYSKELLEELSKYFDLTVYVDDRYKPEKSKKYKIKNFREINNNHPIVYNIGNNSQHTYIFDMLQKKPGLVILHDSNLQDLNFSMMNRYWSRYYFLKQVFLSYGITAVLDYLKFFFMKPNREVIVKRYKTEDSCFMGEGWHDLEQDRGVHFRWTEKKAYFSIKEKGIKRLMLNVYTEFPATIKLKINNEEHKFKLNPREYQWIKTEFNPVDKINSRIKVFKPLGFISRLRDVHKRIMGIRVAEIRYETKNTAKNLPLFEQMPEEKTTVENKKFFRLKEKIRYNYYLNKTVILSAKAIMTHSNHLKEIVEGINRNIPIKVIREGVYLNKPDFSKMQIRKKLSLENYDFIVSSFGMMQKHKRIEQALISFSKFARKYPNSVYVLVGPIDENLKLELILETLKIREKVIVTGYIPHKDAMNYLYASDVCINLRWPSTGATSASLIKSLSVGTPAIITELPENKDFDRSCLFNVKKDKNEIRNIFKILCRLKENPLLEKKMSSNAIEYIKKNHLWKDKAREIAELVREVYG